MVQFYAHHDRQQNDLHAWLLLAGMAHLLGLIGWLLSGFWGLLLALVVVAALAQLAPQVNAAVLLRMYGGRPLGPGDVPGLYGYMAVMSARAGLDEIPMLIHLPSRTLNAFALGRDGEAYIVISDGLLQQMPSRELVGILGHEIAHIAHNDLVVMGVADLFSRLTALLSYGGQLLLVISMPLWWLAGVSPPWAALGLMVFAPWLSALLQYSLSRSREFSADATAAHLTGDPQGLAVALARIQQQAGGLSWTGMPRRDPNPSLLRSHPNPVERIRRLGTMESVTPPPPVAAQHAPPIDYPPVEHAPKHRITGLWH